jgi:hypothetical protein
MNPAEPESRIWHDDSDSSTIVASSHFVTGTRHANARPLPPFGAARGSCGMITNTAQEITTLTAAAVWRAVTR